MSRLATTEKDTAPVSSFIPQLTEMVAGLSPNLPYSAHPGCKPLSFGPASDVVIYKARVTVVSFGHLFVIKASDRM